MVTNKGHTAGYFTTIDEVARAQVPYFLTREDITAFVAPPHKPQNKHHTYKPSTGNYDRSIVKGGTGARDLIN